MVKSGTSSHHFKKTNYDLEYSSSIHFPLFRIKRFMLNEMFQGKASKFAILLEYKNPRSFFSFSFRATTIFLSLMNTLVYVNIDQGIHKEKN